ncbi:hypothetical protein ACH40E_06940 [Streptomyces acidicola]|uniref:hypothetical protein n=1 Tax=Streptomyces acidicola TaxID=2596892 RepID=UPI0037A9B726
MASAALLLAGVPGSAAQAAGTGGTPDGHSEMVAGGAGGGAKGKPVKTVTPLKTVTLVTGDRVLLDGAGQVTGVQRAKGRERIPFSVRTVAFEVSYDEGATWQPTEAVDGTQLSLEHPAEAGSVSLRAELTDRDGNTLVQTVERTYSTPR